MCNKWFIHTTTNYNIVCGYRTGATLGIIVNNGSATTNSNGANITDLAKAEIGATADGNSQKWNGDISALVFYNRLLSSTEITNIMRYFARYYGIEIA